MGPSAPPGMMPQYAAQPYAAQPYAAQPYAAQPYVSMVQPAVTAHPMQPAPTDKWEATPAAAAPTDAFMGLPSPPVDPQHLIKDNAEPQGYPANSSAAVEMPPAYSPTAADGVPLSPAQRIKGSRVSDPSGQIKTDQTHGLMDNLPSVPMEHTMPAAMPAATVDPFAGLPQVPQTDFGGNPIVGGAESEKPEDEFAALQARFAALKR